jgi:hypothetical protein
MAISPVGIDVRLKLITPADAELKIGCWHYFQICRTLVFELLWAVKDRHQAWILFNPAKNQ